ncbi:DUF3006 domain-containing protein [Anaerospora sp.]|uniref:DUF3006 domain-containing protein n=1 Tax=Anaerospora sp. TaxID=1960278 RepID=UPI00289CE8E8|nr:DUF3006 domain-containing protein [Anaerospora sp.]MDF2929295.1 hypothetical protein [Anaerospora sp.]
MIKAVIDRFEGNKAILLFDDTEDQVVWPKNKLPDPVAEGDILTMQIEIDVEATAIARKEADALLQRVLRQNKND